MDNIEEFLKELTALTLKHKIAIGGCGCCGSPYLFNTTLDCHSNKKEYVVEKSGDDLKWE